jgi:hypothetical protein
VLDLKLLTKYVVLLCSNEVKQAVGNQRRQVEGTNERQAVKKEAQGREGEQLGKLGRELRSMRPWVSKAAETWVKSAQGTLGRGHEDGSSRCTKT